jgi:selenide,water dikinase
VDLGHILHKLKGTATADLLVGFDTADDAAVYRLDSERALVSSADFITPVVDDPRTFGAVAATNSLSDIYAMGGRPLLALNLMGYPQFKLPTEILADILIGAAEKCAEAGCTVAGGHTVRDDELKFGLAVTGLVHPDKIMRNSTARAGDRLVLTKPLGTGALVAALRKGRITAGSPDYEALVKVMTKLNGAGPGLTDLGASACTDVTGFGLTGHALEMASASDATFVIETRSLPLLPNAVALCGSGFTCGGTTSNANFTQASMELSPQLGEDWLGLLHDPQTSGGLLISVPERQCAQLVGTLLAEGALCAAVIGDVRPHAANAPYLRFI